MATVTMRQWWPGCHGDADLVLVAVVRGLVGPGDAVVGAALRLDGVGAVQAREREACRCRAAPETTGHPLCWLPAPHATLPVLKDRLVLGTWFRFPLGWWKGGGYSRTFIARRARRRCRWSSAQGLLPSTGLWPWITLSRAVTSRHGAHVQRVALVPVGGRPDSLDFEPGAMVDVQRDARSGPRSESLIVGTGFPFSRGVGGTCSNPNTRCRRAARPGRPSLAFGRRGTRRSRHRLPGTWGVHSMTAAAVAPRCARGTGQRRGELANRLWSAQSTAIQRTSGNPRRIKVSAEGVNQSTLERWTRWTPDRPSSESTSTSQRPARPCA